MNAEDLVVDWERLMLDIVLLKYGYSVMQACCYNTIGIMTVTKLLKFKYKII